MNLFPVYCGESPCPERRERPEMSFTQIGGEPRVCLADVDAMPPFLMTIVSASDMWLFVGSNGPFTAGRVEPDRGIFPYQTADKVMRPGASGCLTVCLVERGDRWHIWEPWHANGMPYRIRRRLLKHVLGAGIIFEESNEDLGIRFAYELATCQPYGLVRRCRIENFSPDGVRLRCLDGWRHLIAPGVTQETYARLSYLAAGYMRHHTIPCGPSALGIYALNAAIADRAEPLESLRAGAAWCVGHESSTVLLCERQVEAFRRGEGVICEDEIRGDFGALLVAMDMEMAPGACREWIMGADTWLDPAAVVALRNALHDPGRMAADVAQAIAEDRRALKLLVGGADGLQSTADQAACAHHAANVVFNCMRGGTCPDGGDFPSADLAQFVRQRNRLIAERHAQWLAGLPERMGLHDLLALVSGPGVRCAAHSTAGPDDPQLRRLLGEYLPLTFSRRHGDPSRPWNHFAIRLKDDQGRPLRTYQGNWRDIFQNWEALARSFPAALPPMIATFLSASTADGYNPYRITREGVDWEIADPADVWGHFGYWGDHQIVYLLRLLEACDAMFPGALARVLRERRYACAHVPYEIVGLDAMMADPRHTLRFNRELHEHLMARAADIGGDGRLLTGEDGMPVLVTLAEKLLIPLLTKLTNLAPGGGIWLNTQRPEWNDANNALAGWGLSVVTVCYLRRYLVWLERLLAEAGDDPLPVSEAVAELAESVTAALGAIPRCGEMTDSDRLAALRSLGHAGETYRHRIYREGLRGCTLLPVPVVQDLITQALRAAEDTIRANRRDDGLYHSYNILSLGPKGAAIGRLPLMLEGQVAVLSAGLLAPDQALAVCRALRGSALYRPDQTSYMLYPDRDLPSYLEKNTLPDHAPTVAPILAELAASGDASLVVMDEDGGLHFNADLRNARDVAERLDALEAQPRWAAMATRDREAVLGLWEQVFRHSEFTGRSGSFFMFEGLGSIYWHMVAKLLVAVQENWLEAAERRADPAVVEGLAAAYREVRDGLGYRKPAHVYGAFPTDPYSHTPRHAGAQQPGMTGQVKEEILTRWGELGIVLGDGVIRFEPRMLDASEFRTEPARFDYVDARGEERSLDLPASSLAFTCCGTPVLYVLSDAAGLTVVRANGDVRRSDDPALTRDESAAVLARTGDILRIEVRPGRLQAIR